MIKNTMCSIIRYGMLIIFLKGIRLLIEDILKNKVRMPFEIEVI